MKRGWGMKTGHPHTNSDLDNTMGSWNKKYILGSVSLWSLLKVFPILPVVPWLAVVMMVVVLFFRLLWCYISQKTSVCLRPLSGHSFLCPQSQMASVSFPPRNLSVPLPPELLFSLRISFSPINPTAPSTEENTSFPKLQYRAKLTGLQHSIGKMQNPHLTGINNLGRVRKRAT